MILEAFIHKSIDLLRNVLGLVKEGLLLVVLPIQSKVSHAITLPKVLELGSCTVDYSGDLVRIDKF